MSTSVDGSGIAAGTGEKLVSAYLTVPVENPAPPE